MSSLESSLLFGNGTSAATPEELLDVLLGQIAINDPVLQTQHRLFVAELLLETAELPADLVAEVLAVSPCVKLLQQLQFSGSLFALGERLIREGRVQREDLLSEARGVEDVDNRDVQVRVEDLRHERENVLEQYELLLAVLVGERGIRFSLLLSRDEKADLLQEEQL